LSSIAGRVPLLRKEGHLASQRCLPTDLFFDHRFTGLSSNTVRLIWIAFILDADDFGRGKAYPEILARKFAQALSDVELAIAELEVQGMLQCYEVEGLHYYWLPWWHKLQKLSKPTPSRLPPAPGEMTTPENLQGNSGNSQEVSLEDEGEEKGKELEVCEEKKKTGSSTATSHTQTDSDSFIQDVARLLGIDPKEVIHLQEEYPTLNLRGEAEAALQWMREKQGKNKVSLGYFRSWLTKSQSSQQNITNQASQSRQPGSKARKPSKYMAALAAD